jgi:hypothetical protein
MRSHGDFFAETSTQIISSIQETMLTSLLILSSLCLGRPSPYVNGDDSLNVDVFLPVGRRLVGYARASYADPAEIPARLAEYRVNASLELFYWDEDTHGAFFSAVNHDFSESKLGDRSRGVVDLVLVVVAFRGSSADDSKIWDEDYDTDFIPAASVLDNINDEEEELESKRMSWFERLLMVSS